MPETWRCVDCGFNTAPGLFGRERLHTAFAADFANDGVKQVIDWDSEVYTLKDKVWKATGLAPFGGCLCIGCVEVRIGRRLDHRDFVRSHIFNRMPASERLLDRRTKKWRPPPDQKLTLD